MNADVAVRAGAVVPRGRGATLFEGAMLVASVSAPALLAAAHARHAPDAAHDEGVVRVLGLGWTGALRALDVVAAPLAFAPGAVSAGRGAIVSAAAAGIAGGLGWVVARALLAACAPGSPRTSAALATVAMATATLALGFQLEAGAVGGAMIGVALALAPLAFALATEGEARDRRAELVLLGALAIGYEPLVGVTGLAGLGAWKIARALTSAGLLGFGRRALASAKTPRSGVAGRALASRVLAAGAASFGAGRRALGPANASGLRVAVRLGGAALVGLAPALLALGARASRASGSLDLDVGPLASWAGERGGSPAATARGIALAIECELGPVTIAMAFVGLVVGLLVPRARSVVAGLTAMAGAGLLAGALGAPAGPTRYAAPALVASCAVAALAAAGMQAVARGIARVRAPLAEASAAMVVLLFLAAPVRAADDTLVRLGLHAEAAATWDEVALGPLPEGAVVLVHDPGVMTRLYAARAARGVRPDLSLVPTYDLAGAAATRELAREPRLLPLVRDMALKGTPDEGSLSSIAAERPLVTTYDPRWDRALARHLVPLGLFARYEPEPRAASDRRMALDAFAPARDRLASALAMPRSWMRIGEPQAELRAVTARLLGARLLGLCASHDRDLVARAIADVRAFAPADPLAAEVARRAGGRGAIDVRDLRP